IPEKWRSHNYPPDERRYRIGHDLKGLPDDDKKYLRVYYEVLDRYPREPLKYEEDQLKVLREIPDKIPSGSGSTPALSEGWRSAEWIGIFGSGMASVLDYCTLRIPGLHRLLSVALSLMENFRGPHNLCAGVLIWRPL